MKFLVIFTALLFTTPSIAQEQPPKEVPEAEPGSCPSLPPQDACSIKADGGVCLTKEQKEEFKKAVQELDEIHNSPAEIQLEPIIVIRDWENRIYINGGSEKPLKGKVRIGDTVDRDVETKVDVQVHYRPEPSPPIFRLRIRAQLGILVTPLVDLAKSNSGLDFYDSVDVGVGWDFFTIHAIKMNVAAYTGLRSIGGGIGLDITKNFGVYGGYSLVYQDLRSSALAQFYFSFN